MDGLATPCPRCGAPASTGRFCTNCGARLGPTSPEDRSDDPSYDVTSTHDRIPVVPPAPAAPRPLFRDEVAPVPAAAPVQPSSAPAHPPAAPAYAATTRPAEPVYAEPAHAGPRTRRLAPGVGLWIGAAVGLVLVLVLGAFLLLGDDGGSPSSSPTAPLLPPTHHTPSSPPASTPTSTPPTSTSSSPSPGGPATEVAGLARASAPRHAPAGVDFAGRPVTFVAPNMVDGALDTCWRAPGDATGSVLTFRLDQPTVITQVGLVNGYAKTVFPGGHRFDWYHGDRRVLAVEWIFDDGTTVSQQFTDSQSMQTLAVTPVTTTRVRVKITSVSRPGHGPAARNDTAISEVSLVGSPG